MLYTKLTKFLFALVVALLGSINIAQALPSECETLEAPVTFIESTNIVCLQNVKVADSAGTSYYKAALKWMGSENPNQFSLVSIEGDIESENGNSSSFSEETGILNIPTVDIPKAFGTERYSARLVLKHKNDVDFFELQSSAIYINPDYIPNETWKPYTMLSPKEKRNVNILGESLPFAKLANSVYDFETLAIESWDLIEEKSRSSGMQAGLYRNRETNELVLAFRGTEFCEFLSCSFSEIKESGLDVFADAQLTLGFNAKQFRHAYEFAQDVANRHQGQTITVTGHSLGGGLAQAIGSAFGVKTFAFNSAPVPEDFIDEHPSPFSLDELNNIIHVIGDIHDPVSNTDESGSFYLHAAHISSLIQFDFSERETLPDPLAALDSLRFNKHGMIPLIDNATELLAIYRDGW